VDGSDGPLGAVNSTNGLATGSATPDKRRFHLSKLAFEIFSCSQNAPRDRPLCSHRSKISRHSDSLRRTLPFKDICIPFLRVWGNGQVYFDKSETGMTPIIGRLRMKRARFTEEQIIGILKEAETAGNIRAVCREHNLTEQTFYRWRNKYGGMDISEARKLRELERENSELKKIVADLTLDNRLLKDLNSKKW
jgi:putative transposase